MKTFIALLLALSIASCAVNTLITSNSVTVAVEIKANTANSSNVDVAWTLDYPDTFPTEVVDTTNPVVCFNAASNDYAVANSSTGLTVVGAMWTCSSGGSAGDCDTIGEIDTTFAQTSGTAGATTAAGQFNTGVTVANTGTFTATVNATTNLITRTITAVTPAAMTTAGLPNTSSTYYYRCFGELGAATAATLTTGISNVVGTLTATANVTVKGSATGSMAILALAGSLMASLAF